MKIQKTTKITKVLLLLGLLIGSFFTFMFVAKPVQAACPSIKFNYGVNGTKTSGGYGVSNVWHSANKFGYSVSAPMWVYITYTDYTGALTWQRDIISGQATIQVAGFSIRDLRYTAPGC
jgi:hypothetical protein